MYINTNIVKHYNLNLQQVALLQILHQAKNEDVSEWLESYNGDLDVLHYKGFLSEVKAKNKQESVYKRLRLNKKGREVLDAIETPDTEEQDKTVFEWLKNYYLKADKEIGNGSKTLRHIRDFRVKSGIEKNNLIKVCLDFISDEDNMQYNNVLEFAFYKPLTAFQTRFQLEDSRLYKHYLKKEQYFKSIFEEY